MNNYILVVIICILLIYCIHLTMRITNLEEQMSTLANYTQAQCDVNHNLIRSTDILKDIILDIQKKGEKEDDESRRDLRKDDCIYV